MKKVQSNFEVVKDKVGIVQLDLLQFVRQYQIIKIYRIK
jgi:hypothetical protein